MKVHSVRIIVISSLTHIPICIIITEKSVAKIPRVFVENQITTLSMVKIAIKFSPCIVYLVVDEGDEIFYVTCTIYM